MKAKRKSTSRKAVSRDRVWKTVKGGVTAPQGYLASGIAAGIKKRGLDLAIVFSSQPASGAAAFTLNQVQAAPVLLSKKHLKASRGRIRAVLLNSGCANACTGEKGIRDALVAVRSAASHLEIDPGQVLMASTGVIGSPLPVHKVLKGISAAISAMSSRGGDAAARAIMTTDTVPKSFAVEGRIGGRIVRIGGMAKGSGMIHPRMATMLSVITTDARIPPAQLGRCVRRVVERTFNCLTVDGDTSTNDMVVVVANGAANAAIEGRGAAQFEQGLERVCEELAKSIARDGEGATKFVEILVRGAGSFADARRVAKAIANSTLVKTALYGEEFNWGRILCAAGNSGVAFDPESVTLALCGIPIYRDGTAVTGIGRRATRVMKARDLRLELGLGKGRFSARVWTCDLSRGYVDINASYIS